MKKIGITGSIASGKTTASKILSLRRGPLFSADKVVKKLYFNKNLKKKIVKEFNINNIKGFKNSLKEKIFKNKKYIKKLEMLIHPLVRKKMKIFSNQNRKKKIGFFEVPLLVESNLMKFFDVIIFVKARKDIRLKRFKSKGGEKKLFDILNNKQISDVNKIKYCDHVVVNEKNLKFLKKKLLSIIKLYV